MALSESSLPAGGLTMAYGPPGHRRIIKPKKGSARGSTKVRLGGKQNFYVRPRGRRR